MDPDELNQFLRTHFADVGGLPVVESAGTDRVTLRLPYDPSSDQGKRLCVVSVTLFGEGATAVTDATVSYMMPWARRGRVSKSSRGRGAHPTGAQALWGPRP